jgi:hypothetical protein
MKHLRFLLSFAFLISCPAGAGDRPANPVKAVKTGEQSPKIKSRLQERIESEMSIPARVIESGQAPSSTPRPSPSAR